MKYIYGVLSLLTVAALNASAKGAIINETAGLSGYPGARNVQINSEGIDSITRFQTDNSLQEVFEHFNAELLAGGWQQTDIEMDDDEIEAEYAREWRELELDLDVDDGGYKLKVDFEDNDRYDDSNR